MSDSEFIKYHSSIDEDSTGVRLNQQSKHYPFVITIGDQAFHVDHDTAVDLSDALSVALSEYRAIQQEKASDS